MMETLHDSSSRDSLTRTMAEPDVYDCISTMLIQEQLYLCCDYLNIGRQHAVHQWEQSEVGCDGVDETCRMKMTEWCFHVVDCTKLRRETVSIAMGYLDRFLCSAHPRAELARQDRREYQLAAMVALYLAVKIYEPLEMDANLVSKLSRGLHSAAEITAFEYDMLVALCWRLCEPSPHQICNYLLELLPDKALNVKPTLFDFCQYQNELSTSDYAYVPLRRSIISVAALLNALEAINQQDLQFEERMAFIDSISRAVDYDICSPLVNAVRVRLLESFAKSSGCELPQVGLMPVTGVIPLAAVPGRAQESFTSVAEDVVTEKLECYESPVCVKEMSVSLEGAWKEHNSI